MHVMGGHDIIKILTLCTQDPKSQPKPIKSFTSTLELKMCWSFSCSNPWVDSITNILCHHCQGTKERIHLSLGCMTMNTTSSWWGTWVGDRIWLHIIHLETPWLKNPVATPPFQEVWCSDGFHFGSEVCTSQLFCNSWFSTSSTSYIRIGRFFSHIHRKEGG